MDCQSLEQRNLYETMMFSTLPLYAFLIIIVLYQHKQKKYFNLEFVCLRFRRRSIALVEYFIGSVRVFFGPQ